MSAHVYFYIQVSRFLFRKPVASERKEKGEKTRLSLLGTPSRYSRHDDKKNATSTLHVVWWRLSAVSLGNSWTLSLESLVCFHLGVEATERNDVKSREARRRPYETRSWAPSLVVRPVVFLLLSRARRERGEAGGRRFFSFGDVSEVFALCDGSGKGRGGRRG